jgi:hypothetical protein
MDIKKINEFINVTHPATMIELKKLLGCDRHVSEDLKVLYATVNQVINDLDLKEGDKVELTRDVASTIGPNSGWYTYRHAMVAGAKATVYEVSFWCKDYSDPKKGIDIHYYIVFDNLVWESHYDENSKPLPHGKTILLPVKESKVFYYRRQDLRKIVDENTVHNEECYTYPI